jgi:hypothetical protein
MEDYKMDCKTARKYLLLFKKDELTDKERTLLKDHLFECMECTALSKDLELYKKALEEIAGQEPYLSNPGQLTDSIMSNIRSGSSGLVENSINILRHPLIRIAASFLILVQIGLFSYQHFYIAESVKELKHMTQNQDLQSNDPNSINKECIEESKKIITDILGYGDPDFNRKAIKYSRKLSNTEIENYAVQICQYSNRIENTGSQKQKKELLISIIHNELNINL